MSKRLPDCIRCGLCCIVAPCDPNEENVCKHLLINDNLTTTCLDKSAVESFVGTGCTIRGIGSSYVYDTYCETHNLADRKKDLKEFFEKLPGK